jgi:uncharacterized membrane protein YdcZ (DUF606 family)
MTMPRCTRSNRALRRTGDRPELLRLLTGMAGVTFVTLILLIVQLQVDTAEMFAPHPSGWSETTGP